MQSPEQNERDLVATDEMIRNLRAGTFQKIAYGIGAVSGALLLGASLLVWTWKHGNDPEAFKEALRHMPPLTVTVKLEPDSKVTLAQPAMVTLAQPSMVPAAASSAKNNNDPAIQTSVTVFKTVTYKTGEVITGWTFERGAATKPIYQYCYWREAAAKDGRKSQENVADDGVMLPAPSGVTDQNERFAACRWFNGDLT